MHVLMCSVDTSFQSSCLLESLRLQFVWCSIFGYLLLAGGLVSGLAIGIALGSPLSAVTHLRVTVAQPKGTATRAPRLDPRVEAWSEES